MADIRDIRAHDIEPEEAKFLTDEPLIPVRGITIFAGFRGVAKTTLATWLTAKVSNTKGGEVFFASKEDDLASSIRPRIEAAGANLKRVRFPEEYEPPLKFPQTSMSAVRKALTPVRHFGQSGGKDAFEAVPDATMPDDVRVLACLKMSPAAEPPALLT
jgi:hypothetical protein